MESDPEHYKAMEILADLREKMQESMKLPPEEQVEDTYIEAGHASFISPLDIGWAGPLAEEADKRFNEEL